jgi:hypothetical protein
MVTQNQTPTHRPNVHTLWRPQRPPNPLNPKPKPLAAVFWVLGCLACLAIGTEWTRMSCFLIMK